MDTPFVGPSYNLDSRPASVQRTVNMMPVPLEPGNERAGWVFRDVPGLVNVTLRQAIVAEFSSASDTFLAFTFTDLTIGDPVSWAWTFGDGSTSTEQNPFHTYTAAGTYTVTLVATNADGLSDDVSHDVTAVVAPHDEVLWLTHFDSNAGGWIEERGRTVTTHGTVNAFVPVGAEPAYKFGAACAGFSGSGFNDYLTAPSTALLEHGTAMFVWDCWVPKVPATAHPNVIFAVSKNDSSIYPMVILHAQSSGGNWGFFAQFSSLQAGNAYSATINTSIPDDTSHNFHHVRLGRINSTTVGLSVDGGAPVTATISGASIFSPSSTATSKVFVGWTVNGDTSDNTWTGGIDELCCRAVAMNSSSFTPPTVPWVYP